MCKQCIIAGVVIAVVVVVLILAFNSQQQTGRPLINNTQVNDSVTGDDPAKVSCTGDSDCTIQYNVWNYGHCDAGCFSKDAEVDPRCDMRWEPITGACICVGNGCVLRAVECGDGVCSAGESCALDCPTPLGNDVLSVKQYNTISALPGGTYNVRGFVIYKVDMGCSPCPEGAACSPCPPSYVIISDTDTIKTAYSPLDGMTDIELYIGAVNVNISGLELQGSYVMTLRDGQLVWYERVFEMPCTDSDGGNDTATWGMATGIDPVTGSQVTTGDYCALADEAGNIQMVDSCSNSNPNCKLFEMNCEPGSPYMDPNTVECPGGCDAGICV